ncbi:hypothetical protein [Actinoplanes sp. NPDC049599]|uniref:hypothetical protein n=1 Tax=Actinoplanes sp. NPDC049599 TaxID=3363903 RepID=UPI0037B06C17
MTGDPGYSSAVIEVPQAEAAAGTTRSVWSPTHGQLTVVVPPGTVDGSVVWVQSPTAGNVAVTIRVSSPFPPPQPYPGQQFPTQPYPAQPQSGVPAAGPGYPPPGYPPPGQPQFPGQPFPGQPFPGQQQGFAPPPAAPSHTRRNAVIGGSLVVLLALGCCGIVRVFGGGDDDSPQAGRNGVAANVSGGPTATGPLTPEQYVQALAASDAAIGATFSKLNTSDTATFAKAAPAAASAIRAEADKLRATQPPSGAAPAHGQLTLELESLGDMVEETAAAKQECPAASPWVAVLQSGWADGIREDAKKLAAADATFKFGTFLPAAPKETKRRLKTGTFLKRSSTGGSGHFKIKNGADDTTVSLVPTKGKKPKPVLTVYVRGGGTFTAKGVRDGTYRVYTASGEDWDKGKKGFTRDCSFSKFDDTFKFTTTSFSASIWTITLTPVVGGNASTSDVDPNSFPK